MSCAPSRTSYPSSAGGVMVPIIGRVRSSASNMARGARIGPMHTRARVHPMNTTLTRADKVGAEGFEPPSTGLEPVVLPGYTIPPRQYIGQGNDISTERCRDAHLTACSACGQLGGGGVSCDATSIADCRPSSRHDFPASLIRPTCSPYMSKSGHSEDDKWAIQDLNPCSRIRNPR